MAQRHKKKDRSISWDRACEIFGNPQPPKSVSERQFDYCDDDLKRLANTPYEQMDFSDLWYYYLDLAYVKLQPELFAYLFPGCLMDWHFSLMRNEGCSHGDAEFHFGIHQGHVFEKLLTTQQLAEVCEFFRDSFLERLDVEQELSPIPSECPSTAWIGRFNSLGLIIPRIEVIWNSWWSLETPGQAMAAIQYCSGLMYFDEDNPLFKAWDGFVPRLWRSDSWIYGTGWSDNNCTFLKKSLTLDFVNEQVPKAVYRLSEGPDFQQAQLIEKDLPECQDLLKVRLNELPGLLSNPDAEDWTV